MKRVLLSILLICSTIGFYGLTDARSSPVMDVFEGITPCNNIARPAPQIPADTDCEEMIWHVTLYHNPATYELHAAYGLSQPNTTGLKRGGTKLDLSGTWSTMQGTPNNPDATIYALNPDDPDAAIYLVKMDENLLHVASPDLSLLVGNGAWSYTLNRTDSIKETMPVDAAAESAEIVDIPNSSDVRGVFDGRMPCGDIVYGFTGYPRAPDCLKIKWRLTLYQDMVTGKPTAYHFKGTETSRDGTWTQERGTRADPNAMVYRLSMSDSGESIAFLKADDNHLYLLDADLTLMVGDRLWSYTLSRKM